MSKLALAFSGLLVVSACAADQSAPNPEDDGVFGELQRDPALSMTRDVSSVSGTLTMDDGSKVSFSSVEQEPGVINVVIEVNGLVLTMNRDWESVTIHGALKADGKTTVITPDDRFAIHRLLAAVEAELFPPVSHVQTKAELKALRSHTAAEKQLFRALDAVFSQWPSSQPVTRVVSTTVARGYSSVRKYTDGTNLTGYHDCNQCGTGDSDCRDSKKLGRSWNGANHGNCGTSSSGTQYTWDCVDHDQCVRTDKHGGHVLASPYCSDELWSAGDDEVSAPSCDWDHRGTSNEGSCPTSWNGDNECDCFCQFRDSDC